MTVHWTQSIQFVPAAATGTRKDNGVIGFYILASNAPRWKRTIGIVEYLTFMKI
jgi:hypothetical protein